MLVAVVSALGVLGVANVQIAGATHPRPKGATPLRVPIVPAYTQCTTRTVLTVRRSLSRPTIPRSRPRAT